MEVDEIHCNKFSRTMSNGNNSTKMGQTQKTDDQFLDEDEDGDHKRGAAAAPAVDLSGGLGRYYGWPSSRIVRVSRASGGKDRHSKVLTSKGLRDRRVRLSVNTAIQFYDLQDRLGYDQPSKAVEWLLKAAASSIAELPPISSPFPDTPKQLSYEKRSNNGGENEHFGLDSVEMDVSPDPDPDPNLQHQLAKSCSSNSETSKGSGLSLSRSENRIKARERAKERVAEKEKEKENETSPNIGSLNPISQTTSFTELLNGGISNMNNTRHGSSGSPNGTGSAHWCSPHMDYFSSGLLGPSVSRSGQIQLPGSNPMFSISGHENPPELHQFSFVPDHLLPVVTSGGNNNSGNEYNLNFSISSSSGHSSALAAGFNRGTLQSNSSSSPQQPPPPLLPQLQRFDGTSQSFFIGQPMDQNPHHQFFHGFDGRLNLSYGDNHNNSGRHSGPRGKGKN